MGNVVDFDKGKKKVLEKRKIKEIERKKKISQKPKRVRKKQNTYKVRKRVVLFYGILFGACVFSQLVSAVIAK